MDDLGRLGDLGHGQREVMRFRAEDRLHLFVAHQLLGRGDGGRDVGAVVALDHFELVGLAADLDAAGIVDLLDGKADARRQGMAGGDERAGFRGDDADLDDVVLGQCRMGETRRGIRPRGGQFQNGFQR